MSILSTNKKLISLAGTEYSAGQGIDITNHVISVVESAVGTNYSAGPNINIYEDEGQPTISSKDWSSEIADASANAYEQAIAQIPEPQDLSYISAKVDTNTNGIDYISSVCLTAHQDWTDTIKGASSYSYEQSTSYFDNWVEGQYTGDITNITNKITALSGDFGDYYKKTETSSKDEINDALQYVSANAGKVYEGVSPIVVNNTEDKISADTWTFSAGDNVSFVDDNVNKITRIDVDLPTPQDLSYISAQVDSANQGVDYLSGVVITALPSDMATTGDVAELAQTISETYQTKGDYLVRSDSANFYPTNNPSGFITGVDLSNYYTKDETSGKEELANAFANIPAGDTEVNAYVHNNSASIDESTNVVQSNSSVWNDITAYQSNSANYLTGVSIPESATWNDVSETVQTNSASWADGGSGDEEVNTLVHTNSSTWNTVTNKLDTTAQVITGYTTATLEGINAINSLNGKPLISFRTQSAMQAGVADKARYDYDGNNLADDHNSLTSLKDVVQSNSAQWENGGAITSYTSAWSHDVPPYGGYVIDSLNGKYLSAFISKSANNAKVATNANSATYAQTVDETKLENDGFVKNLSSEYGTISVVRNTIESTNSAISRVGNEGFVSSYNNIQSIGPGSTATYSWNKSLPNTTIALDMGWNNGYTLTYSANTELTGEVVLPIGTSTQTISIPNATEIKAWANDWMTIEKAVVSADDSFETVVGELAWASALPTYEYDSANKISAINGSAIGGGSEIPSGTMNVSGLEYNAVNEISAYNGSAIAQYGAEKQWLVHDDTIVHISNSAQYAFGCNVSALQRLMGIDETVLWENKTWPGVDKAPGANSANMSESIYNFKRIKIFGSRNPVSASTLIASNEQEFETDIIKWQSGKCMFEGFFASTANNPFNTWTVLSFENGISMSEISGGQKPLTGTLDTSKIYYHPYKIIGIGRKA